MAQNLKPQLQVGDGAMGGGGQGRGKCGQVDLFNNMFAQKPMQLKDWKCNGCGLDVHKGEYVKKDNHQQVHYEMAPVMKSLKRKLDKVGNNAEERERVLKEFGKEMGSLILTRGGGRGSA